MTLEQSLYEKIDKNDDKNISMPELTLAVEEGFFDDAEEMNLLAEAMQDSEFTREFFEAYDELKNNEQRNNNTDKQDIIEERSGEKLTQKQKSTDYFFKAMEMARNEKLHDTESFEYKNAPDYAKKIFLAYKNAEINEKQFAADVASFASNISQNTGEELHQEVRKWAEGNKHERTVFLYTISQDPGVRYIKGLQAESASGAEFVDKLDKMSLANKSAINFYCSHLGIIPWTGYPLENQENYISFKDKYLSYLGYKSQWTGKFLHPDLDVRISSLEEFRKPPEISTENTEPTISLEERTAFWQIIHQQPVIQSLNKIQTQNDIDEFIKKYNDPMEVSVLQYYLPPVVGAPKEKIDGIIHNPSYFRDLILSYRKQQLGSEELVRIESIEDFNAHKNQTETLWKLASLLRDSMKNESFVFAWFREGDDQYEKHIGVLEDQMKIVPHLHPDKISMAIDIILQQSDDRKNNEESELREDDMDNLMRETRELLCDSRNFLSQEMSDQFLIDFLVKLREIDANSRGTVVYTTSQPAEKIVDPMIYGDKTISFDKKGLSEGEREDTDNLQEQIVLVEDICNNPQTTKEIHTLLKETQHVGHANLLRAKLQPLALKLEELGIQCTNYETLARQLRNGMKEFWDKEEETKKDIKKSLVDNIEFPEGVEDKEECLKNIDQCVDCIYDFQELMFATNMFGPLFRFATLESNAGLIQRLGESSHRSNQALYTKFDITGAGSLDEGGVINFSDATCNTAALIAKEIAISIPIFIASLVTGGAALSGLGYMLRGLKLGQSAIKASRLIHFVKSSPRLYAFLQGAAEGLLSTPISATLKSLSDPSVNGWNSFLSSYEKQMTLENFVSTAVQVGFLKFTKHLIQSGEMLFLQAKFPTKLQFEFTRFLADQGFTNGADVLINKAIGNGNLTTEQVLQNILLGIAADVRSFGGKANHNPVTQRRRARGQEYNVARDVGEEFNHRSQRHVNERERLIREGSDRMIASTDRSLRNLSMQQQYQLFSDGLGEFFRIFNPNETDATLIGSGSGFLSTPSRTGNTTIPGDIDLSMPMHQLDDGISRLHRALQSDQSSFSECRITTTDTPPVTLTTLRSNSSLVEINTQIQQARAAGGVRIERDVPGPSGSSLPVEVFFNRPGHGLTQTGLDNNNINRTGLDTQLVMINGVPVRTQTPRALAQGYVINFFRERNVSGQKIKDRILKIASLMPDMSPEELIPFMRETVEIYRKRMETEGPPYDPFLVKALANMENALSDQSGTTGLGNMLTAFQQSRAKRIKEKEKSTENNKNRQEEEKLPTRNFDRDTYQRFSDAIGNAERQSHMVTELLRELSSSADQLSLLLRDVEGLSSQPGGNQRVAQLTEQYHVLYARHQNLRNQTNAYDHAISGSSGNTMSDFGLFSQLHLGIQEYLPRGNDALVLIREKLEDLGIRDLDRVTKPMSTPQATNQVSSSSF